MNNPKTPTKTVWIKCRAREACEGNQAEIVFDRKNTAIGGNGSFVPEAGGRSVRYRCLTCKNVFHVNT